MKFKYSARTKDGELQVGFVEAASQDLAANVLTSHNLFVLSLESAEAVSMPEKIVRFWHRVKLKDIMIFTRQFATLLEAQVPLSDSLKDLHRQTKNSVLQGVIYEITNDVNSGLALSQALERQGSLFPEFYISMIKSAEITGRLQEAMIFLADYLDKETAWRSRIQNALIYPAFVAGVFFIVVGIMTTFVFPQLEPVFKEFKVNLPWITVVILTLGRFVFNWWWAIIIILIIFIFALVDYFKSREGKMVIDQVVLVLPVVGNLFKKIYVARFAEITSVLIKGGVPVAQALEIASHSVANVVYEEVLHNVAEKIRTGELLSQALTENGEFFPPLVSQMVAIGEKTGRLEGLLSRVASFYNREVNGLLDNLIELIQPALIVVVGVIVSALFAAVLLPIFNITQGI